MVDENTATLETDTGEVDATRIYEVGYMIVPAVKEEDLEKTVGTVRSEAEKAGANFIAEGAPAMTKLAYEMFTANGKGGKRSPYDRAYFGWLKFEAKLSAAKALDTALMQNKDILRHVIFKTVREDTRAKMKAPTLREVRRTDTIKAAPRPVTTDEVKAPVSEEVLEKALHDLTD